MQELMGRVTRQLPTRLSDDPTSFISLANTIFDVAYKFRQTLEPEVVAAFYNLLEAATSFVRLYNTSDATTHNGGLRGWIAQLGYLTPGTGLLNTPQCSEGVKVLINAARDGGIIDSSVATDYLSRLGFKEPNKSESPDAD
jgi:hypothetical protein